MGKSVMVELIEFTSVYQKIKYSSDARSYPIINQTFAKKIEKYIRNRKQRYHFDLILQLTTIESLQEHFNISLSDIYEIVASVDYLTIRHTIINDKFTTVVESSNSI